MQCPNGGYSSPLWLEENYIYRNPAKFSSGMHSKLVRAPVTAIYAIPYTLYSTLYVTNSNGRGGIRPRRYSTSSYYIIHCRDTVPKRQTRRWPSLHMTSFPSTVSPGFTHFVSSLPPMDDASIQNVCDAIQRCRLTEHSQISAFIVQPNNNRFRRG